MNNNHILTNCHIFNMWIALAFSLPSDIEYGSDQLPTTADYLENEKMLAFFQRYFKYQWVVLLQLTLAAP